MAFYIDGKLLQEGTSFYDANGTQYPSGWLNQSTEAEKAAIGITWVADVVQADDRFYWDGNIDNPKALEDVTETVDDKEYITKGLKSNFKAQVKDTANKLLANTDWYVIRKAERSVDIPTNIADKRSAIVTEANRLDSEIDLVDSVEGLIAILNNQTWS
jgi:hypothetical protein